jgi:hypothetical protein
MSDFTRAILEATGTPEDKITRFFGKRVGANNAKKYWYGISLLAKKLEEFQPVIQQPATQEEISYNKDNSRTIKRDIEMSEDEASSPISIMKKMGFNPMLWEVITCRVIRGNWDVTLKLNDTPETITNHKYSVTLTVKPLTDKITGDVITSVFSNINVPKLESYNYDTGNKMLELPLLDFHVGKFADSIVTGDDDYNLQVAQELYKKIIVDILKKINDYGFDIEEIVFPIGQDFFHIDTPSGTTTSGTLVDTNSSWQEIFATGVDMLVWGIEQLRAIAPVRIMYVAGNHDEMLSYCALVGIAHVYKNTLDVSVDTSPSPRKYVSYGTNLIGYSHGRDEGKRIVGLMQIEVPELWANTRHREWHLGDLHHESVREDSGLIIRRISSVSAPDAWHGKKGYVGTQRKAFAFIWDKDCGLETIIYSSVD